MYTKSKILFLHSITPLHAGSGSEIGIVDLPIQREKHTHFPKIEASSLKGALREAFEKKLGEDNLEVHLVFGYDEDADKSEIVSKKLTENGKEKNTEYSGAVAFSDARLLLFPVKSGKNTFAYITCPYILSRFNEELNISGKNQLNISPEINNINKMPGNAIISSNSLCISNSNIMLDEYVFKSSVDKSISNELKKYLDIPELDSRLVVLGDDDFTKFALNSTEIITRIKINNETGTVEEGALFNEEYLPAESVLYSMIFVSGIFNEVKGNLNSDNDVLDFISNNMPQYFQIGGNATLGKGIVKTKLS